MVNTFLLDVPHLRRRKQDALYQTDRGSLQVIRKFLERKKIDFQRLDWNIPGYQLGKYGYERLVIEYDKQDRDPEMSRRLQEDRFIVLNSSGLFHHRSFYFVEPLEEVCYVQLDSHPDFGKMIGRLAGDNFVPEVSQLDNVEDTYVVGVTPNEALVPEGESLERIRERTIGTKLILSDPLEVLLFAEDGTRDETFREVYENARVLYPYLNHHNKPTKFDVESLPNLPVYLSIDLDVIKTFPSIWEGHGRWDTVKVLDTIFEIADEREIIGGDICGLDKNFFSMRSNVMKHYRGVYSALRYCMSEKDKEVL